MLSRLTSERLVSVCVRLGRGFTRDQFCKCPLRAHVEQLKPLQVFFRLY